MTNVPLKEFQKYSKRGAYHWDTLKCSIKKHNPYLAGRYRIVLDLLRNAGLGGRNVLDIGCGDGALSYLIAKDGWRVTGIDYSGTGLGLATDIFRERNACASFVRGDSCSLPVKDGSFDAVVAADIIEHLADPERLLKEINRVLKKGGTAVVTTPVKLTDVPVDPEHVREFTRDEFKDILDRHFDKVKIVISHPEPYVKRYGSTYRFLGFIGRFRPYKYLYNFMSSYMGYNLFLRPDSEGRYTQMSALVTK
jgi:ubiquinone/menaquinone biosynthesis C-methylase UbiE